MKGDRSLMSELHPLDELVGRRTDDVTAPPARRRRRKRKRGGRFVVLLVALLVVALGAYAAVKALGPTYRSLTASDDYKGSGSGSVSVEIQAGQSGRSIGDTLEKDGVVKSASAFASAASSNPAAAGIQPGTYTMRLKMSSASALALLLDTTARVTDRVVVREGLRATATIALLAKETGQPLSAYQAALKNPTALGVPSWAHGKVEGLLWPATYSFAPKTTAAAQLSTMVHLTTQQLSKAGVTSSQALKVLTIASIVQVESRATADGPKVARVLDNRLAQGIKLQLDSTVSYVTGKPGVATTSADRANPSPYNTYVHAGLPPGPISNPGLAAIKAALRPASGTWLWFVTVNPTTGETRFESTEAAKIADTHLFNQWCAAHLAACKGTG
jgi:UPF0755 protein